MKRQLAALLIIVAGAYAHAEIQTARIFEIGKTAGPAPFVQTTKIETKGNVMTWESEIADDQKVVVMTESARIVDGRIVSQAVEQRQIGERYELSVQDGKARFQSFEWKNGVRGQSLDENEVQTGAAFVTGPMMQNYLRQNWETLKKGETVKVDFGVFELAKSVGFQFRREPANENVLRLIMKPANFIVSMLVDPMTVEFDSETQKIKRFTGRTPIRQMKGGKLKAMDAEILYDHKAITP